MASLDIIPDVHICGICRRKFTDIYKFIDHKKECSASLSQLQNADLYKHDHKNSSVDSSTLGYVQNDAICDLSSNEVTCNSSNKSSVCNFSAFHVDNAEQKRAATSENYKEVKPPNPFLQLSSCMDNTQSKESSIATSHQYVWQSENPINFGPSAIDQTSSPVKLISCTTEGENIHFTIQDPATNMTNQHNMLLGDEGTSYVFDSQTTPSRNKVESTEHPQQVEYGSSSWLNSKTVSDQTSYTLHSSSTELPCQVNVVVSEASETSQFVYGSPLQATSSVVKTIDLPYVNTHISSGADYQNGTDNSTPCPEDLEVGEISAAMDQHNSDQNAMVVSQKNVHHPSEMPIHQQISEIATKPNSTEDCMDTISDKIPTEDIHLMPEYIRSNTASAPIITVTDAHASINRRQSVEKRERLQGVSDDLLSLSPYVSKPLNENNKSDHHSTQICSDSQNGQTMTGELTLNLTTSCALDASLMSGYKAVFTSPSSAGHRLALKPPSTSKEMASRQVAGQSSELKQLSSKLLGSYSVSYKNISASAAKLAERKMLQLKQHSPSDRTAVEVIPKSAERKLDFSEYYNNDVNVPVPCKGVDANKNSEAFSNTTSGEESLNLKSMNVPLVQSESSVKELAVYSSVSDLDDCSRNTDAFGTNSSTYFWHNSQTNRDEVMVIMSTEAENDKGLIQSVCDNRSAQNMLQVGHNQPQPFPQTSISCNVVHTSSLPQSSAQKFIVSKSCPKVCEKQIQLTPSEDTSLYDLTGIPSESTVYQNTGLPSSSPNSLVSERIKEVPGYTRSPEKCIMRPKKQRGMKHHVSALPTALTSEEQTAMTVAGISSQTILLKENRKSVSPTKVSANLSLNQKNASKSTNLKGSQRPSDRSFTCKFGDCSYTTKIYKDFQRHYRTHTGERPYGCGECGKTFNRSDKLKIHMRWHSGQKPFQCKLCDYASVEGGSLKKHMLTHTDERPFKCQICPYASRNSSHLIVHLRTHTGDSPFHCTMCTAQFKINSDLKRHLRVHTGEKPFHCDKCDYKSSNKGNLKTHYKINHSEENEKQCPKCDFVSSSLKRLRVHLKTHEANSVIMQCKQCEYVCTNLNSLKSHMTIHNPAKPFMCNFCQYSSKQRGNVKKHMTNLHPEKLRYGRHRKSTDAVISPVSTAGRKESGPVQESGDYRRHRRSTSYRKLHVCQECGSGFVREDSLRCHVKQHGQDKNDNTSLESFPEPESSDVKIELHASSPANVSNRQPSVSNLPVIRHSLQYILAAASQLYQEEYSGKQGAERNTTLSSSEEPLTETSHVPWEHSSYTVSVPTRTHTLSQQKPKKSVHASSEQLKMLSNQEGHAQVISGQKQSSSTNNRVQNQNTDSNLMFRTSSQPEPMPAVLNISPSVSCVDTSSYQVVPGEQQILLQPQVDSVPQVQSAEPTLVLSQQGDGNLLEPSYNIQLVPQISNGQPQPSQISSITQELLRQISLQTMSSLPPQPATHIQIVLPGAAVPGVTQVLPSQPLQPQQQILLQVQNGPSQQHNVMEIQNGQVVTQLPATACSQVGSQQIQVQIPSQMASPMLQAPDHLITQELVSQPNGQVLEVKQLSMQELLGKMDNAEQGTEN